MKKLLLILMLYTGVTQAQHGFEIGLGYGGNGEYGKAYLEAGSKKFGGSLVIGGDSKITYGGQDKGKGYFGANVYYNILDSDSDWLLKVRTGFDSVQPYIAVERAPLPGGAPDPNDGKAQPDGKSNQILMGGVSVGYKFFQLNVNYSNGLELGFGFILTRR